MDTVEAQVRVKNILRMLRPKSVIGFEKIRVGRAFDGGYIMVDDFSDVKTAYSLGINNDTSWDLDIANRGIDIFQYDHTINELSFNHERFKWEKIGISASKVDENHLKTLTYLIRKNQHLDNVNMILKCDIEGVEYGMLSSTDIETLSCFRQIVLEIHNIDRLGELEFCDLARRAIHNVTAVHNLVHVHANNYGHWTAIGGIPLPAVLELTFANKNRYTFNDKVTTFPGPLDMPNDPAKADYYLGYFIFD